MNTTNKAPETGANLGAILDQYENNYGDRRQSPDSSRAGKKVLERHHLKDRRTPPEVRHAQAMERLQTWKQMVRRIIVPTVNHYQETLSTRHYPADISEHMAFHLEARESYVDQVAFKVSAANLENTPAWERDSQSGRLLNRGSRILFRALIMAGGMEVTEEVRDDAPLQYCVPLDELDQALMTQIMEEFLQNVFS